MSKQWRCLTRTPNKLIAIAFALAFTALGNWFFMAQAPKRMLRLIANNSNKSNYNKKSENRTLNN